jgi:Peptidase family M28
MNRHHLTLCLLGILVLAVITALAYRPPEPRDARAGDGFSAYRAQSELEALVGNGIAHPIGSEANARLRSSIVRRLTALGYETEVQTGLVCNSAAVCGTPSNIIARPRRATSQNSQDDVDQVLLAAHYDSVPAGPGAADDAAGVATILEIARILATRPPTAYPIAILITDGEEAGLLGALLFVRDHPLAKHVVAAVNLEARGDSGPSLMFETGAANAWLMSLYRHAIARPITDSVYYDAYQALPNNTDFSVFKSAGWQGFNFAFIGDVAHYHTALDTFANVDLRSIQHQGDNALASLLALADSTGLRSQPAADAVYFDVFARALISWPARFSLIAASATLTLLLFEAALLCRSRRVALRQVAWGILGALSCVVLAGLASSAALLLLIESGKVPPLTQYSWIAHPAWMDMTCAALAAGAAGILSHRLAGRAGFWGFWLGALLLLAILSELLAALRPGLCFLPLVATTVGVIAVIPSLRSAAHTWLTDIAVLAPAWVMFALMLPFISLLYGALGSVAWVIDTLVLGLGATLLLPLAAIASKLFRRRIIAAAGVAGVLGIVVTLMLPTYSASWPQRLDFRYRLDADEHRAVWIAEPDSLKLPAYVASAAAFEQSGGHAFEAPAPASDLPPPLLTLRSVQAQSSGATRYNLHLQSMRNAPEVEVLFPAAAKVGEIILDDPAGERRVPLHEMENDMTRLRVVGLQPQGMDFTVEVRGTSLEARIFDQSYTLVGGEFLKRLRPPEATSSQDGDTTIVQTIVTLEPAAGR